MKRLILPILGFLVITLALSFYWEEAGGRQAYAVFLKTKGAGLLDVLGIEGVRVAGGRIRYINWIPFVGLMLVTPGLTLKRRFLGLVIGLVVLFATHLGLNATQVRGEPQLPLVPSLVSDTLPFLIWIIAAFPALSRLFEFNGECEGEGEGEGEETQKPENDQPAPPHE